MSARNYPTARAARQRHKINRVVEANRRHRARLRGDYIRPNSPADIARWWARRGL